MLLPFSNPHFLFVFQSLYESIKNEQFKIPEDDGNDITRTFFNPDREGWLIKEGNGMFVFFLKKGQFKFLILIITVFSIFKVDCTKVGGNDTLS